MDMNIFNQIEDFKKMISGQDPKALLENLVKSGKVTKEQFEDAKRKAESFMRLFSK